MCLFDKKYQYSTNYAKGMGEYYNFLLNWVFNLVYSSLSDVLWRVHVRVIFAPCSFFKANIYRAVIIKMISCT